MAVQAQYPSNALHLNRSGQEGKMRLVGQDYSLEPQTGGGYFDQSNIFFNNNGVGGANPRKRGREAATSTTTSAAPMTAFSLHNHHHPLLTDLSQFHSQQPNNVVSTGLALAFGDQSQQQQQRLPQQQQHTSSSVILSLLSEDLASQIKQQRDEIDRFLHTQGEQLRRALAEKRQRHYRALVGAVEEAATRRLREKEVEVQMAARRNEELEARAAQLSSEAQVWQAKARAQEAAAVSLQAQLQHAIMSGGCEQQQYQREAESGAAAGDAAAAEDAESAYVDPERVSKPVGPVCRACGDRVASVVLFPCRHLCVCAECDGVVQACPLCLSLRNSSVEVNIC